MAWDYSTQISEVQSLLWSAEVQGYNAVFLPCSLLSSSWTLPSWSLQLRLLPAFTSPTGSSLFVSKHCPSLASQSTVVNAYQQISCGSDPTGGQGQVNMRLSSCLKKTSTTSCRPQGHIGLLPNPDPQALSSLSTHPTAELRASLLPSHIQHNSPFSRSFPKSLYPSIHHSP